MKNTGVTKAAQIKKLQAELTKLQTQLTKAYAEAGVDPYIAIKVKKNQSRFERVRVKGASDRGVGHYFMVVDITAKKETVYIPLSIASGKKPTGFGYQIEGTAEGTIVTASVTCQGGEITQVTLGTLTYAKIPAGNVATFQIQIEIRGSIGKVYTLRIYRLNYKLHVTDARYHQYLKEIPSDRLKFS